MTVEIDIAIEALDYIGKATIRAFTDKQTEASVCERSIGRAILTTLEAYDWGWARSFRTLASRSVDMPPGSVFLYAYDYPNDALKIRRIGKTLASEAKPVPFEVGKLYGSTARVIYTTREAAIVVYTQRNPDLSLASPSFITAAAWNLGTRIVGSLRRGEPGWLKLCQDGYRAALSNAQTLEANEGSPDEVDPMPDFLVARGYSP